MNGFQATRAIREQVIPPLAILILTAYDQVAYVQAMLKLKVKGYWLKTARGSDISTRDCCWKTIRNLSSESALAC